MSKTYPNDKVLPKFDDSIRINVDMDTPNPFGLKFKTMDEFADWLASWFERIRNNAKAEIESADDEISYE